MTYMETLGKRAKEASKTIQYLGQDMKNTGLRLAADELVAQTPFLLAENEKDILAAEANGMKPSLVDRLRLTPERIEGMAVGLRQIADLQDPIGEVLSMNERPNGLRIGVRRVPLGVVGIIYESRPNVTADAFGLCLKTGNVTILRGGKDAIHSNKAIIAALKAGLRKAGIAEDAVILVEDTGREHVEEMMRLRDYIDVVDLAKAHVAAVNRMTAGKMEETYEIFNIGTGRPVSVLELLNTFEKVNDLKLPYTITDRRPGDVPAVWADTSYANEVLGWKAERTLEETLKSAWEWEKQIRKQITQ